MIVNRRTFIAKPGQTEKVVEILNSGLVFVPFQPKYRLYISDIAPFNQVALEVEFNDLAEYDRFWSGATEKSSEEWWKVWFEATDNGGANEIWKLASA
jgi:hypothetical protein